MKLDKLSMLVFPLAFIAYLTFNMNPAAAQTPENSPSFVISTNDSEISTAMRATIVLNLEINPAPNESMYFTYNETNTSDGTVTHVPDERGAPNIDFKT